ncbi:phytanoyl-CoA dioxygenase family protein [Chloroflexi bacterium TSY]|nr:phytanoyl-CoA dioxygenase family protein [Chloroflexi bacterium TSY]
MTSIPMQNVEPFVDCHDVLHDQKRLQSRAAENGYLYFPELLPVEEVLPVRQEVLHVIDRHGLLRAGIDPDEGIRKEGVYIDLEYDKPTPPELQRLYNDILSLRGFNAFPHHATVTGIIESLLGEPTFVHPRHICHILFPGRFEHTTEAHQDFHPVRGTQDTWTVWIPLGDCDSDLGGVTVACGSHQRGYLDAKLVTSGELINDDTVWHWNPFRCGDVLMFHSLTIHQGSDNVTADRIRLSTSARYQRISEPVDAAALTPHWGWANWEELYADWAQNDPLKYYWQSLDLNIQTYA